MSLQFKTVNNIELAFDAQSKIVILTLLTFLLT